MAKRKVDATVTLFFINGSRPTVEQMDEAALVRGTVAFRNAMKIDPDDTVEPFDAVMGAVPAQYQAALDAKALTGDDSPVPEVVTPLPPEGSSLLPRSPATPPLQRPAAAAAWKPNA